MNETERKKSGCLILCGGKSERMKRDKAELLFHDESFLEILCEKVRRTGMPGYISLCEGGLRTPADFSVLMDAVHDENGGRIGPLGGIYTGLKQCEKDGLDGMYTVPVDLPLFKTELFERIDKAREKNPEADIYVMRSSDGRVHPTVGYYRTSVIPAAETLIRTGRYGLMRLAERSDLHTVFVPTQNAEQDRMLFNVNTPSDYEALLQKADNSMKHIVLQGEKGAGKSTLIRRLVREMQCSTGGCLSRAVMNRTKGYREIYLYPAEVLPVTDDQDQAAAGNGQLCGISLNGVREVFPEVFDCYGAQLIRSASDKELIVIDEIGTMEETAVLFQKAVLSALDGSVPVIVAIKAKRIVTPYLETVRTHPNVKLIDLDEIGRDAAYEELRTQFINRKEGRL